MGNYYAGMINNTGGYGELKHHGILGQKWGVRRWQNADGSLTAAGRERYNKGTEKYLGKKDAAAYRNADVDTRAAVDKIVNKIKRDELVDAAKTAGVSALLGIGGGMGYNNATFGKREERLANDNKRIKELLYGNDKSGMDIPKTGMPKSSLSMIADIHSKVTGDFPGGGSAIKLRDKLIKNSKTQEDKDKVYKNEKKLIHIIAKWAMDEETNEAEGKMNDYYDKENIGGLFVSKAKRKEYRRLQEEFRQANSRAWNNMANEVYAFINTLPKNQRDVWFAIAYKYMGLDW